MRINLKNPLFVLAAGVLLVAGSLAGATKAAIPDTPTPTSVSFSTAKLNVALQEKQGEDYVTIQETRNADGSLNPDQLGKLTLPAFASIDDGSTMPDPSVKYDEDVQIKNTGDCDEYARVVVYKTWFSDGESCDPAVVKPSVINLNLKEETAGDWIIKNTSDTCTTYYYKKPLTPGQEVQLLDSISFEKDILNMVAVETTVEEGTRVDLVYDYDGKTFEVEMRVDAVQTHSPEEAILGAWGVTVTLDSEGNITNVTE